MGKIRNALHRRLTEATPYQLAATGAGLAGVDPDNEAGWTRAGQGSREMPEWSRERARAHSIAAYRSNPLGRSIVDTYTAFCVGDSGVQVRSSDPATDAVIRRFCNDPKVMLLERQELFFRDWCLNGELLLELLVGDTTGVVRINPIDVARITSVSLAHGNPLWPSGVSVRMPNSDPLELALVDVDDLTGLRVGNALFHPGWRATIHDRRGMPFLTTILDALDSYDEVLSNLIDRTALARYLVWDVTLKGEDKAGIDEWIKNRGGLDVPPSASIEVHNESVEWKPQTVTVGSQEDSTTLTAVHTSIAGGTGLAKTWLSDPDGANRATSVSMAEPVRRRIGSVQNEWLGAMRELLRFVVDKAVEAGRLPRYTELTDSSGRSVIVPPSETVVVTGPQIAASDAQVSSTVMLNLSTAMKTLLESGAITPEAAKVAAEKAWELYTGQSIQTALGAGASDTTNRPTLRAV